jgi:hypothetical protein
VVCTMIVVEELERCLHPPDGQDLLTELDKAHTCVDRTVDDCATEAERHHNRSCRWLESWSTWACCH